MAKFQGLLAICLLAFCTLVVCEESNNSVELNARATTLSPSPTTTVSPTLNITTTPDITVDDDAITTTATPQPKKKIKSVRKGDLTDDDILETVTAVMPEAVTAVLPEGLPQDEGVKSVKKGDLPDTDDEVTSQGPSVGKKELDAPPPRVDYATSRTSVPQGRKKDLGAPPTPPPRRTTTLIPKSIKVSVEEPKPVSVTEPHDHSQDFASDPSTPETSLVVGIVFACLLFSVVGFLAVKRINAVRRRREYRKMNDFLIDGMYNDL